MSSQFVKPKFLAQSMFSMVAIASLVLASRPGYTQTLSHYELTDELPYELTDELPYELTDEVTDELTDELTDKLPAESSTTLFPVTLPVSLQDLLGPDGAAKPDGAARTLTQCPPSRVIASVVSEPMPLPGQKSRSSSNFNLNSIRVGETFEVVVVVNGTVNYGIRFNVKRDRRRRIDPTVARNMHTGFYQRTSNTPLYPVYIANPTGAGTSQFVVQFCRI
jgi:hypothetical protein